MHADTLPARLGRTVEVDVCQPCQAIWFDAHESINLTPGATLALFRIIGDRAGRPARPDADLPRCPRCRARLRRTHDRQRTTPFQYLRCPHGHGRLTTFFDFLREKNFIRPLSPEQVAELRDQVQFVHCSSCGAPVDLHRGGTCRHCGSPLSMLDLKQADALVRQLQRAEDRTPAAGDPSLPLELARARREVDQAFAGMRDTGWIDTVSADGLVAAGLAAVARWLKNDRKPS